MCLKPSVTWLHSILLSSMCQHISLEEASLSWVSLQVIETLCSSISSSVRWRGMGVRDGEGEKKGGGRGERALLQSHCVGRLLWVPLHPTLWLCECWYEKSQLWKWRKCPEFQVWDDLVQKEGQRSLKADLTLETHISRCRNLQKEFRFLEAAE